MNCTEELANPSMDLRGRKGKTYSGRSVAEGSRRFSGWIQVDTVAKFDGDEGALQRQRSSSDSRGERKKTRNGKNEERPSRVYL